MTCIDQLCEIMAVSTIRSVVVLTGDRGRGFVALACTRRQRHQVRQQQQVEVGFETRQTRDARAAAHSAEPELGDVRPPDTLFVESCIRRRTADCAAVQRGGGSPRDSLRAIENIMPSSP